MDTRRAIALALAGAAAALPVAARCDPQADIQRALLEREQRRDELVLQIQQSQQRLHPAAGREQQELDRLQLEQRQRLQRLNAQQARDIEWARQVAPPDPAAAQAFVNQRQQRFAQDRHFELQRSRSEHEGLRFEQEQRHRANAAR